MTLKYMSLVRILDAATFSDAADGRFDVVRKEDGSPGGSGFTVSIEANEVKRIRLPFDWNPQAGPDLIRDLQLLATIFTG